MNSNTPPSPALSPYEQTALDFLAKHGIAFRAVLAKTQKAPKWADDGSAHGLQYRVTLSSGKPNARRLSFSFWDSIAAKEKGEVPSAYDVLACISSDVHCPDTIADFCSEYGYNSDSRAEYRATCALFKRCSTFSRKLRAFFTKTEIEGLSEIQ